MQEDVEEEDEDEDEEEEAVAEEFGGAICCTSFALGFCRRVALY